MRTAHIFVYLVLMASLFQCKSPTTTQAPTTATLLNTYWRLLEVNGEPLITPDGIREVHIILGKSDGENRLKGFGGCNNIAGTFTHEDNKVTFSAASTKMMCPPAQMNVEDFLFRALSVADHYEITGEKLTLLQGETALAVFTAVYLK